MLYVASMNSKPGVYILTLAVIINIILSFDENMTIVTISSICICIVVDMFSRLF